MMNEHKIVTFNQFLLDNEFIIVLDNYDCCILSEYLTYLKKQFDNHIYKKIEEGGYKEISTPFFLHEDLFCAKKSDKEKYLNLNIPALLYNRGHRLKKGYVLSPTTDVFTSILFEHYVHSYRDLPFRVYSRVINFNSAKISDSFIKTFEYYITVFASYVEPDNISKELQAISNIISQLFCTLKVDVIRKDINQKVIYSVNIGDDDIILCDYTLLQSGATHLSKLLYSEKTGSSKHPSYISCRIYDSLFWYFLCFHFDGVGFRLPTMFLPYEVVIISINNHKNCAYDDYLSQIEESLNNNKIRFITDNSTTETVGEKHYKWEKLGIPLRLEVGYNECLKNNIIVINRYTRERKVFCSAIEIANELKNVLNTWS